MKEGHTVLHGITSLPLLQSLYGIHVLSTSVAPIPACSPTLSMDPCTPHGCNFQGRNISGPRPQQQPVARPSALHRRLRGYDLAGQNLSDFVGSIAWRVGSARMAQRNMSQKEQTPRQVKLRNTLRSNSKINLDWTRISVDVGSPSTWS